MMCKTKSSSNVTMKCTATAASFVVRIGKKKQISAQVREVKGMSKKGLLGTLMLCLAKTSRKVVMMRRATAAAFVTILRDRQIPAQVGES